MKLELSKEWYKKHFEGKEGEVGCGSVEEFKKKLLSQYIGLIYRDGDYFKIKVPGFALTVYCSTLEEIQDTAQIAFKAHVNRLRKLREEIKPPLFLSEIKKIYSGYEGFIALWID